MKASGIKIFKKEINFHVVELPTGCPNKFACSGQSSAGLRRFWLAHLQISSSSVGFQVLRKLKRRPPRQAALLSVCVSISVVWPQPVRHPTPTRKKPEKRREEPVCEEWSHRGKKGRQAERSTLWNLPESLTSPPEGTPRFLPGSAFLLLSWRKDKLDLLLLAHNSRNRMCPFCSWGQSRLYIEFCFLLLGLFGENVSDVPSICDVVRL